MPNLFQKLKNNFSSSSSSKSNNESNKKSNISVINVHKSPTQDNDQTKATSNLQQNKQINKSNLVLSLIIDNDEIKPNNNNNKNKNLNENFLNLFDPDEAPDEAETFNHITFIDDRSFIIDDDDLDLNDIEVAQIQKLNELAKENNCYTINELPETSSNKSRLSSSRASSRNSLGSESIRTNSSDPKSSSGGESRFKKQSSFESSGGGGGDESGGSSSTDVLNKGSKNALLDALMQKFNVLDYEISDETTSSNQKNSQSSSSSTTFSKSSRSINQEDQNRKKSELERKINNKINSEKNLKQLISHDSSDYKEASSSFDNDPKYIKLVRSTGTQMTLSPSSSSLLKSTIQANRKKVKSIVVNSLPQVFECKYIGKTKCKGLWGLKNIREPVDRLIRNAKRKRSLNELPDIEALISEKGINIVQKPMTMTDTASLISENFKNLKSGLLPINNISYAVQDNIFGKVFSCIIVREKDNIVISECYSFLCAKNEIARKMALSITLAFKEYAKLIQIKESKINEKIKLMSNASSIQEPDSFA
ncbi:unnamed protein product [Brachionus calyciflorus]|uniref:Uncharacterized protein n=1 Tax=Brachionus calyciflorus TaxID=104777 RepID=A0A814CYP0_9BILA|nr:unnamed protein product [Brachionus calyciflorus]